MLEDKQLAKLKGYRLNCVVQALEEISATTDISIMTALEFLNLLIDTIDANKKDLKMRKYIREAQFSDATAAVEDILYLDSRNIQKENILRLAACEWVDYHHPLVIIGASGTGKSYVAQALGMSACRSLHTTRYVTMQQLESELAIARDVSPQDHDALRASYIKPELLIIDDFLTTRPSTKFAQDLFIIMQRRQGNASTMVVSQIQPEHWNDQFDQPLLGDQITNRLVLDRSLIIHLKGKTMRQVMFDRFEN